MKPEFKLVVKEGYRDREIASGDSLLEISRQIDEMAGRKPVTDGGDRDGSA